MTTQENEPTPPSAQSLSRFMDLPTPAQAKRWEEVQPGTTDRIMKAIEQAERHDQRLHWAEIGLRLLGTLSGLASVLILAYVAVYFVNHNAPTQGAGIFGLGTASIVAAFITNRRRSRE